jgi:mercuric ion transport protein
MSTPSVRREGIALLGISASACVACCAGPLLALLGGLGLAGVASTLLFGAVGLLLVLAAVAAGAAARRRQRRPCACAVESPQ